jgi:CHASE2 domain-containing sensor protein
VWRRLFKIDYLLSAALVFAVLKFLPMFFEVDFLNPIENTLEDFSITDIVFSDFLADDDVTVDSSVVLVNIGHLNRRQIAQQINIINKYSPKVIGFDSFFRSEKTPELDFPLEMAFAEAENLVLVSQLYNYDSVAGHFDTLLVSHPKFNRHATTGFANFIIRQDNFRTVRTFTPKEYVRNEMHLSFPLEVLKYSRPEKVERFLRRNNPEEIIDFRGNFDRYITLDGMDVFRRCDSLDFLRDKIVLMGFLGPDTSTLVTEDVFFTPRNPQYVGKTYPDMYGVVVHANIISMLTTERFYSSMPYWMSILLTVLIVYGNMVLFGFLRESYEQWYEPMSIIIIFVELIFWFFAILNVFYLLRYEIKIAGDFFAIIFCVTAFEAYHDSIKPIVRDRIRKIRGKGK